VKESRVRVTPLRSQALVAILPADMKEVPDVVTPAFAARQPLVLEHARGAVHDIVTEWLAGEMPLANRPMLVATVEAMKKVVSLGLGMSIVPDVAVAEPTNEFIVRPLKPTMQAPLGLVELRNKRNDAALDIVRRELLGLRTRV
jgi:DNA-binding transcriptional LysR family regulator